MENIRKNYTAIDSNAQSKFMAYIIYMIIGSIFHKVECPDSKTERNLEGIYMSGTESLQIYLEENCIDFLEGQLRAVLPLEFINSDVEVRFLSPDKSGRRAVRFEAEGFALEVKARYSKDPYFVADLFIDTPEETGNRDLADNLDNGAAA